jgi:hypothetical protein
MKLKIKYTFIPALLLLCSCTKDFIDLKPISNITSENFYLTQADFSNAVNGAYAGLRSGGTYGSNSYVFGEIRTDNTVPVPSGSVTDQDEFHRFYIKTTNPFISGRWNDCYAAIARCNPILERIGAISMDNNLKARYIAETKFLRALYYFQLVQTFGDVPLVLKEIKDPGEGYNYARSPKAEVYAQIERDLADAEAILPNAYSGADLGRATKGAAKAILGRVLLVEHKYPQAAAKLKEVIDLGVYNLLTNYTDVFRVNNKYNAEGIFDVQYKSGQVGLGNGWPNSFAPLNSGNFVIAFGGDGNNVPTSDLIAEYETNDLRFNATIATQYTNTTTGAIVKVNYTKKYFDVPAAKNDNGNNIPVIRYADVLLMYAEALNEQGYVAGGDAFTNLNKVRTRAGLAALTAAQVPDQQNFRLAMEHERRVEFAFENLRWYDLVRTGRAVTVLNGKKTLLNLVNNVTDAATVFPLPQSQIDITQGKLTQNTGSY